MKKGLKRYMYLLCSTVVLITGCKLGTNAVAQQPVTKTYLALGDSYTIGQSINAKGRYPAQVADILGAEGINIPVIHYIAVTGWTTADLQEAINNEHLGIFDVVTLLIGVNDQYQGVDTVTYAKRFTLLLQNAITLAGNNKQKVIVISIPDYGVTPFGGGYKNISTQINRFNAINKRITVAYHITYVDVTALSRDAVNDHSLLASDGLHYSAKEYRLWAEKIAPLIYQVLK